MQIRTFLSQVREDLYETVTWPKWPNGTAFMKAILGIILFMLPVFLLALSRLPATVLLGAGCLPVIAMKLYRLFRPGQQPPASTRKPLLDEQKTFSRDVLSLLAMTYFLVIIPVDFSSHQPLGFGDRCWMVLYPGFVMWYVEVLISTVKLYLRLGQGKVEMR